MEVFAKIVKGFSFLTIFAKSSIFDVWQVSELVSEASNNQRKKLFLRCLAGFLMHFCFNYFYFSFIEEYLYTLHKTIAYLFTKFD